MKRTLTFFLMVVVTIFGLFEEAKSANHLMGLMNELGYSKDYSRRYISFLTSFNAPIISNQIIRTEGSTERISNDYVNVDMLLGSLLFSTTDFYLEGRNGMNIEISRVYTSHVRNIGFSSDNDFEPGLSFDNSYFDQGWWWFMGKIDPADSSIHYGNGAAERLMRVLPGSNGFYCNGSFQRINQNMDTLYNQDGSKEIYGFTYDYDGCPERFKGNYKTKIEDANDNNYITIEYADSVPLITNISDRLGRTVWFEYSSTDTADLDDTRLLCLSYKSSDDSTQSINYIYDDSIYSGYNPLVMVAYPNGDTIRYAYTDSAYCARGCIGWEDCFALRLSEIILPNGDSTCGKINYDWKIYKEIRNVAAADSNFWHVSVGAIRIANADGTVDTITFDYNYGYKTDGIESWVIYPDSSSKIYFHTDIRQTDIDDDEQDSGLFKKVFYFDEFPGEDDFFTSTYVYSYQVGEDGYYYFDGYKTASIGRKVDDYNTQVTIPFLQLYAEFYDYYGDGGGGSKYALSHTLYSDLDSTIGMFHKKVALNGNLDTLQKNEKFWTGIGINKTITDSAFALSKGDFDVVWDTMFTYYDWDTTLMKIETVIQAADGDSFTTDYEYDSLTCNILAVINPLGDTTCFEYDSLFISPIRAYNQYFNYFKADYHFNTGLIKLNVNSNDDTTFFYYDNLDRLINVKKPLENNYSLIYTYNNADNIVIDSVKLGTNSFKITYHYFDEFQREYKTKTIDADNDSIMTWAQFDERNRVIRSARPYSSTSDTIWTTNEYNVINNLIKTTYPDGKYSEVIDSVGLTHNYLYTTIIDLMGRKTCQVIDTTLNLRKELSDTLLADILEYSYGPFGRVIKITDPRGLETKFSYDGFGNVVSDSSSDQDKYDYFYDSRNRLRFIINSEDDIQYRKYDNIGRLLESGIFSGADSVLEDSVDNVSFPASDTTIWAAYRYDSYSDFTPNNSNPLGQLTEVDDRSGKIWLVHDERGRVSRRMIKIDGLSDTLDIYYTYGAGNQLTQITYPDSSQITYDYYNSGRVRKIPGYFDLFGQQGAAGFEYEPWGGISKMIHRDTSFTTTHTYNNLSLPTKIFCRYHAFKKWGRDYSYNDARMIETVRDLNSSGNPTTDTLRTYDYDYVYRLQEAYIDADTSKTYTYKYDQSGNRDTLDIETGGNHAILEYNLHYDSLLTYFEDTVFVNCYESGASDSAFFYPANTTDTVYWDCTFTSTHHLSYFKVLSQDSTYVDVNNSSSGSFIPVSTERIDVLAYCYCLGECSVVGKVRYNKVDTTQTEYLYTNKLSHLSGQSPGNYEWDDKGCLIEDNANNIEYFFDEANHLDSVIIDDIKRYEFKYDAGGRRVKKIFYTGIACDSIETCESGFNDKCEHDTSTCMFVPGDVNDDDQCDYDDVEFLEEFLFGPGATQPSPLFRADVNCDGKINGKDVTYLDNYLRYMGYPAPKCCYWLCNDTLITYYIYSGNQVIAEYDEDGDLIYNYLYLDRMRLAKFKTGHTFKHYYVNDIRGSVAAILYTDGSTIASFDYYPFGDVLTQTGDSHLKYTGKELDEGYDFDLYYYGARYYNSGWGRFISPDPVREYYNPYSYCKNEPINFIDPFGTRIDDPYGERKYWEYGATATSWAIGSAIIFFTGGTGLPAYIAMGYHGLLHSAAAVELAGAFYENHVKSELDKIASALGIDLNSDASYNEFIDFCIENDIPLEELRGKTLQEIKEILKESGIISGEEERLEMKPGWESSGTEFWGYSAEFGGCPR